MVHSRLEDATGLKEELIGNAWSAAVKAHKHADKPFLLDKTRDFSIISFAGSWSPEAWFSSSDSSFGETKIDRQLFPSVRSIGLDEYAEVNSAFFRRFEAILGKLKEVLKANKPVAFTGHSAGGPVAILATIWLLEQQRNSNTNTNFTPPKCITFGSPLVGNFIFSHALKREKWSIHFVHFVTRYDIVPRIHLAPLPSLQPHLQTILTSLNSRSLGSASNGNVATEFFMTVMRNASAVASNAACHLMGNTNLLLDTLKSFVKLSPYSPFGTYIFFTDSEKVVVVTNPDAVLQILFFACQLSSESECDNIAHQSLKAHWEYESKMRQNLELLQAIRLDELYKLPLSLTGRNTPITQALNELGLSSRALLNLRAAGSYEEQKIRNQERMSLKKQDIEKLLNWLEENYRDVCKVDGLGYYDAFKLQKDPKDFQANIKRLEQAGIWDEIVEMLKRYELPDEFEGQDEWIQIGRSAIARFSSGFGLRMPSMSPVRDDTAADTKAAAKSDVFKSFTKGLVDTSQNAVKAMQVKARHIVSQNKRRYQEGEFDLDMTYITENIIGMGFPAGHMSSGLFGFIEGFYRNHMEEVIKFFETHHKGKYKVYNLCSERLYDASLFEGKVAHFPFDDHNCPPIHLIKSFCLSAYAWLKEDIENVVVVHCKAGMARTGLMICSLLLFLKFFHTSAEAIDYYNQKRCVDGKALVLPSQIRYVKYFERILIHFNGNTPPGRRCMLRGFRLHKCPYWVRPSITISNHSEILFSTKKHPKTKDLMPEDFWIRAPKKGFVVFALPGEPGLTELSGDFKIHFHDRHGDFYCWLNTTMTENKVLLSDTDLDGFDKRKLPTPGFQVEVVMIDYNGTLPTRSKTNSAGKGSDCRPIHDRVPGHEAAQSSKNKIPESEENDDVFSDSDEENGDTKTGLAQSTSETAKVDHSSTAISSDKIGSLTRETNHLSLGNERNLQINAPKEPNISGMIQPSGLETPNMDSASASEFKAIAADASVFTFGDEEDFDSE